MDIWKNGKILLYSFVYFLRSKFSRKEIPFIGGLVVNEKCNLNCLQCRVANRKNIPDLSYKDIKKGLSLIYAKKIRSLFIEGGEPFLWSEKNFKLEDVVKLARKIGFLWVSIYTNGTIPLDSSADTLFVSLDGLKETNNKLRGKGENCFDKVLNNIKSSTHKNIIINFTINSKNKFEIKKFCEMIQGIKNIKGIFFNFHTPYYGLDDLYIDLEEKRKIIDEILTLKKKYKILNSTAALKSVFEDKWKRPTNFCCIYANNKLFQCCRAIGDKVACENCGYLMYPEIIEILNIKPFSILSAFKYLPGF